MLLDTGAMDKIKELIISLTDDKRKHVIIVAFGFGAFLEGCAGAGTPAAVCAPLLMGLGISPVSAVLGSLIANGIWSSWGAAGLTCSGGFEAMVQAGRGATYSWPALDNMSVTEIYNMLSMATARVNAVGALLCPWVITAVCYGKKGFKGLVPFLFINSVVGAACMILVTHTIGFEFTSIITGIVIVAVNFIYLKAAKPSTPAELVTEPSGNKERYACLESCIYIRTSSYCSSRYAFRYCRNMAFQERFCGLDRYNYSWRMFYRFSCTRIYKELP